MWISADEALKIDPSGRSLRVILPTSLQIYAQHYRKRAEESIITITQAEALISQLELVKSLGSLIENNQNITVDQQTYFERNAAVIQMADALIAFHVNNSPGVADTIEKARAKRIPVAVFTYSL